MSDLVTTDVVDLRCGKDGCDCRPRQARIDFFAFRVFREATGKSLLREINLEQLDDEEITALVYAALKHEDPDLTLEHIERHLTPRNAQPTLLTILSLYSDAFEPAPDGVDPLPKRRPARARGRRKN